MNPRVRKPVREAFKLASLASKDPHNSPQAQNTLRAAFHLLFNAQRGATVRTDGLRLQASHEGIRGGEKVAHP